MIPIVGISGSSGSGKTVLIEAMVAELGRRGHSVGAIKHHRGDLEVDREGKDSYRHKKAGALAVAIITPKGSAVIRDEEEEPDPYEVVERYLFDCDVVLAEGYKTANIPKIALIGNKNSEDLETARQELSVALVSDEDIDVAGLRRFKRDEIKPLADFIEERFIKHERPAKVSLRVDGRRIPMKPFVRDLVDAVVRGMVGTFKGAEKARKISIFLEK